MIRYRFAAAALGAALLLTGCGRAPERSHAGSTRETSKELAAERAKLSPDDRALVEAQEWCVISTGERLGAMGPPLKLDINGQPVFVCCKECRKKAEANPERTLAKLEELKARAKAERDASK